MIQIALPLDWPEQEGAEVIAGGANAHVLRHLERWSTWPVMAVLIIGPRKSGRTRLARRFALRTGGRVIDNARDQPEETIFHAWNAAQESRKPLAIVADAAPPAWKIRLPDLASRIAATPVLAIGDPDDALIARLFEQELGRRGLLASRELIAFLGVRVERDYIAVHRVIEALDQAALSRKSRLSVALAREVLASLGMIDPET